MKAALAHVGSSSLPASRRHRPGRSAVRVAEWRRSRRLRTRVVRGVYRVACEQALLHIMRRRHRQLVCAPLLLGRQTHVHMHRTPCVQPGQHRSKRLMNSIVSPTIVCTDIASSDDGLHRFKEAADSSPHLHAVIQDLVQLQVCAPPRQPEPSCSCTYSTALPTSVRL